MANAELYTVSVTTAGDREVEFRSIMSQGEVDSLRKMLEVQLDARAVLDYGIFQCGTDEYLSYEKAVQKLTPR